jgi:hypothetical protein
LQQKEKAPSNYIKKLIGFEKTQALVGKNFGAVILRGTVNRLFLIKIVYIVVQI